MATFFQSMAHEYRTPLNTILPLLKLLPEFVQDPTGKLMLRTILNSAIFLENVINDSLDIARMHSGNFEVVNKKFDILQAMSKVNEIMSFQATAKNLSLEFYIEKNMKSEVTTDRKRYL